jgi:hypothetical protein
MITIGELYELELQVKEAVDALEHTLAPFSSKVQHQALIRIWLTHIPLLSNQTQGMGFTRQPSF